MRGGEGSKKRRGRPTKVRAAEGGGAKRGRPVARKKKAKRKTEIIGLSTRQRDEDLGFRRISGGSFGQDSRMISAFDWRRQFQLAHYLWLVNPIARRVVELVNDFVVGDGFSFQAKNDRVGEIINEHWTDPDNDWDLKLHTRAVETSIFGQLSLRAFVNDSTGHVRVASIDPNRIADLLTDPEFTGRVNSLKMNLGASGDEGADLRVVREDRDSDSASFGMLTGEAFWFPINNLTFMPHGLSDLFHLADWLDGFDQFVFSAMERIRFLNAHVWDVTIEGAGGAEVQERASEIERNPPQQGGFRVHNEKEKWGAVTPDLKTGDIEALSRLLKIIILGAAGIPEHWFAAGSETNFATAKEMSTPIFKRLTRRQAFFRDALRNIIKFQIDQAVLHGNLTGVAEADRKEFNIIPPEVSEKDTEALASTLNSLVTGLDAAASSGWVSEEDAAEIVAAHASKFGIEVQKPNAEEIESLRRKRAERGEDLAQSMEAASYHSHKARKARDAERREEKDR